MKSIDIKDFVKIKIGDKKGDVAYHEDTYWYFDIKGDDARSKEWNKFASSGKSKYETELRQIPSELYHPQMSKTIPKGKDYITWRYIHPKYKSYQKGKPFEKMDGVHQVIYKGKVIKQIIETGDCKKDAMILYTIKKLVYELLKQKFNDKKLLLDISEKAKRACIPRYEDLSGMNLFNKRMFE